MDKLSNANKTLPGRDKIENKENIIIGIDIGNLGAAVSYERMKFTVTKPLEYIDYFRKLRNANKRVYILIEKLHAFPGMSSSSSWKMAENQGYLTGLLDIIAADSYGDISYNFVTAKQWQKPLNLPKVKYKERKELLYQIALKYFPNNKDLKKYNADAFLICNYAINYYKEI